MKATWRSEHGPAHHLTFPAVHRRVSFVCHHAYGRNVSDGHVSEPKSQRLGLQISCRLYPEMPTQDAVYRPAPTSRRGFSTASQTKGEQGHRRSSATGSRPHDARHSPKYAVSNVVGFIKGKSAIHLARVYGERRRNFVGQHFWARGYFVSTVGRDENGHPRLHCNQEKEDRRLDQLALLP